MRIGVSELIVVFIVALLVIGPDKLPRYARKLGAALAEFRKASDEATREIRENVVGPLEEAQRPLREAAESVEDAGRAVRSNLDDVKSSLGNVGRAQKSETQAAPENAAQSGTQSAPDTKSAHDASVSDAPSGEANAPENVAAPDTSVSDEPETVAQSANAVASAREEV